MYPIYRSRDLSRAYACLLLASPVVNPCSCSPLVVYCFKSSTGHQHAIKKRQESRARMFNDVELHDDDEKRRLKSLNFQTLIVITVRERMRE